ncbi:MULTISPECIES: hypothetical protein [Alteromonadaceae]|jgi:uncharacterized Tic20 family protein|uniref:Uncharacterized protein n=1 Tax=Brumicola blandensis TaxID=3075611 RepID=A0AAW8R4W4_9ALTE|nr:MULTISPECIES: hypothetical protein [unclassified Alteromonas]MDT0583432.1 hypothetical protein [Alteromonas sp. W409]MDT0629363.1 hypothetical protein [Alteromonas sp. W364]
MNDRKLIFILKIVMTVGISLILLGVYFHLFSPTIEEMGVNGIIISAACVAIGMALSLPTKMFLTFVLVKREQDQNAKAHES